MNKIDLAKIVCKVAHDASGQKRKYTGSEAALLSIVGGSPVVKVG